MSKIIIIFQVFILVGLFSSLVWIILRDCLEDYYRNKVYEELMEIKINKFKEEAFYELDEI